MNLIIIEKKISKSVRAIMTSEESKYKSFILGVYRIVKII